MVAARRVANPIAVRRFMVIGDPDREVVLTIGRPRENPRLTGEWRCTVLIEGLQEERRFRSYGSDAMLALQLALESARIKIDKSGLPVSWRNELQPGDLGLPLPVPYADGLHLQRRIEHYIERQKLELASYVTAILGERARRRAVHDESKR